MATTDELEQVLGQGVRARRQARDLTQVELAELANVSLGALKHLEHGDGATTTTLVKVLRALGAEGWLTTLVPPPEPFNPVKLLEQRRRESRSATGRRRVRRAGADGDEP